MIIFFWENSKLLTTYEKMGWFRWGYELIPVGNDKHITRLEIIMQKQYIIMALIGRPREREIFTFYL